MSGRRPPKALRPLSEIVPVLWRCLCGQFNNTDDKRCIACGAERSWLSPLAEALVAAQRRSLATLEKAYVAGAIEAEPMAEAMEACGITDAVDRAFLLASLDVLKEWGVAAPTMSERVARENGEPKRATEGQVKYALDLLQRNGHPPLAEQDVRGLSFERASQLIDSLKAGSYKPDEWDVPF